ncbi:MAG: condensation domain-containing protein [Peptococcaceae bacterium]|nr:condensation domain-containing protein [Peptococcaceae bacterium]
MTDRCGSLTLPANTQDRLINAARHRFSDWRHHAVLELRGRLNENRLSRAVRLSLDAEPILGSRFMADRYRPFWQQYSDPDGIEWFALEKAIDKAKAINEFLAVPLAGKHDQQAKIKLIRARDNDVLCIKMSHACCDGGGLRAYQHILSEIYTCLDKGGNYSLAFPTAARRDQNSILGKLGPGNLLKACMQGPALRQPTWAFPSRACEPERALLSVRRLPGRYVQALADFAEKNGASTNDLILAAYYRALFKMIDPPYGKPQEILITLDLRRHFGADRVDAVNNLSSAVATRIAREPAESFAETLAKVSRGMTAAKSNLPGIAVAVLFGLLSLLSYEQNVAMVQRLKSFMDQTGRFSPILSNIGNISKSTIRFGPTPVEDAYHVSPALYAPGFMLGACTYNNRLTFTVSYYEPGTPRDKVEEFLDALLVELDSCI